MLLFYVVKSLNGFTNIQVTGTCNWQYCHGFFGAVVKSINGFTKIEKRTNTHVEGWNLKFTKLVGEHHPNIFKSLEVMRKEQAATELKLA